MDAILFKQKLKEYIDLQYMELEEKRKSEKSFDGRNLWEKSFQKTEHAESILSEYIETLKYTKKRWFGKQEVLYREVKGWEFEDFYLKKCAIYSWHGALSDVQNTQRYRDFMSPLREAHRILKQIIESE